MKQHDPEIVGRIKEDILSVCWQDDVELEDLILAVASYAFDLYYFQTYEQLRKLSVAVRNGEIDVD